MDGEPSVPVDLFLCECESGTSSVTSVAASMLITQAGAIFHRRSKLLCVPSGLSIEAFTNLSGLVTTPYSFMLPPE